ncbi:MAG: creatininase family protein [Planctomycetes bacterium]|nr:creatininase family protein [Planctomycetota bacterium]
MIRLAEVPWSEARRALPEGFLALLPVGSTEAHGPHLPLGSDVVIAAAMAENAAARLEAAGHAVALLPALPYGVTECAGEFFGTLSIAPATLQALLLDLARSLQRHGCGRLGIANGHLEPDHRRALRVAAEAATSSGLRTACPDVVRGLYAKRLGAEFVSGACHAGSYEGSIVLAARPEQVREGLRRALPENPISLGAALAAGHRTFRAAGGPEAYFGAPAAADPAAGRDFIATLGAILAEEMEAP